MRGAAWTWLRLAGSQRPILVDSILAGSALVASLALGQQDPVGDFRPLDPLGDVLTCVMNAALVARRRAPGLVFLGYAAAWSGYIALGYWPVVNSAGAMLALYTVAAQRPARNTVPAAILTGGVWMYGGLVGGQNAVATMVAQSIAWPAVLCYFGNGNRRVVEQGRRLQKLAAQLRRDREARARRAVTEERIRIARELHDVVAHHISVIGVQAGLARYVLHTDLDTAAGALDTVLSTGTEALDELRRLLAVLRTEPDDGIEYDPAPGVDRLGDLAERVRAAGVPVDLVVTGVRRPLPSGMDLCVYRVVQEGLTNVLKHAGPARARVVLRYERDRFIASVTDDGRSTPSAHTDGHGLMGMAERAKLYGGSVTAGPRAEGGFEVVLTVPTGGDG
jgi:signal transduction histidine kinase